ncbi:hypothetical protein Csa_016753 [Cucumis sativus]|uniref:Uncharacterized protein n=1 Tax=Cucumis sativus TaxID=3659 RepID=A0A0A0K877_CUCSA|nr:hypothetical protein Csa_016753 [Cucumis sativus]
MVHNLCLDKESKIEKKELCNPSLLFYFSSSDEHSGVPQPPTNVWGLHRAIQAITAFSDAKHLTPAVPAEASQQGLQTTHQSHNSTLVVSVFESNTECCVYEL